MRADRSVVAVGLPSFELIVILSEAKNLRSSLPFSTGDHRSSGKVDRLLLKTMSGLSPKAQISGGKAVRQLPEQRVEDNALHLAARFYANLEFSL
jgi:hypothetical protein